jgi:arginine kinase
MSYEGLTNADFSPEDSAMVVSTRIRVGRNLDGYPLGPGVTKEQRLEIMDKVTAACSTFEGELAGKFYSLEGMTKEDQEKLVGDHFLFKRGDRFLEACNLNRDWPSGRGIFHNEHKTFLVWVNEEDQLRIISMQQGSGIKEVFQRLSTAATEIEKIAKFSHDEHLGYITSCPTNLGTALRASVHIKLPKLSKNKDQFNEIAAKYHVQIRGIHGEHTETDDGIFDISNKRRLGRSEAELVQDMIDGVHAMIEAEKAIPDPAKPEAAVVAEAAPVAAPEAVPEAAPEAVPEAVPEAAPETGPEAPAAKAPAAEAVEAPVAEAPAAEAPAGGE